MATTLYEAVLTATTGSIAAGAASTLSLSIGGNNAIVKKIKIVPSVVGSGEYTRVKIYKKSTCLDADRCFDTNNFESNLYAPKYDDGTGPVELNEGYVCDYEDLDATGKLNVKLFNNGASAKTFTYYITLQLTEKLLANEYTPTLFNTTNVAASVAFICFYSRSGNYVTVYVAVSIDPTLAAPTLTQLGISIPIPSDFAAAGDAIGNAIDGIGQVGIILADSTNNRVVLQFFATSAANQNWFGSFRYKVI
jgi:hypothetical protein